jgi:hypothetical protein
MHIATLGAGHMAGALARPWLSAGHDVTIAGRTPAKAAALAAEIGARAGHLADVAADADVLLLAVLAVDLDGVDATLRAAGADDGALAGKVLIDCMNPVEVERFTLTTRGGPDPSLAARVQRLTGARVVKAFNLADQGVWRSAPRYGGAPQLVPVATDDADARATADELVRATGAEPLDAGSLEHAEYLEAMGAVIIRLLWGGRHPTTVFQLQAADPVLQEAR